MKITYTASFGMESTAYLDDEPADDTGIRCGTDKYTDRDVRVRWNGECWIEVPVEPPATYWPRWPLA